MQALKAKTLIKRDFDEAFAQCDVILTPTTPEPAFRIGEKSGDPLAMKLSDVCTITVNMAGNCAISLPCGFHRGLPIGLQIIGGAFAEETILRVAHAYEEVTDWHLKYPKI